MKTNPLGPEPRFAAIHMGPSTHLDHFAPICEAMDIPLITTELECQKQAHVFYPQMKTLFAEPSEISFEFLSSLDALFTSGAFWALELNATLELLFGKRPTIVHCSHGHSDKTGFAKTLFSQDIVYIYGQQMWRQIEMLGTKETRPISILTGNLRLEFFLRHYHAHFSLVEEKILCHFSHASLPIVLYAPTWGHETTPSIFFSQIEKLINQLEGRYRLLIKLHPFIEEDYPAHTAYIKSVYERKEHLLFVVLFLLFMLFYRSAISTLEIFLQSLMTFSISISLFTFLQPDGTFFPFTNVAC